MFDMSWSELLLIAVVALIVIGPKDLPKAVKTVAQVARKARTLAREFQSGLEEMAREAELHEVKQEIESTASADFAREFDHSIDPGGEIARSLELPVEGAAGAIPAAPVGPSATPSAEVNAPPAAAPAAPVPAVPAEDLAPKMTAAADAPATASESAGAAPRPPKP